MGFLHSLSAKIALAGLFASSLVAGSAWPTTSAPLATLTPCPSCPSNVQHPPITITEQLQTVSTCAPTSTCFKRKCHTKYPCNDYQWVSTVIPCDFSKGTGSSCTVTKTEDVVPVSKHRTTLTSYTSASKTWDQWGYSASPSKSHRHQGHSTTSAYATLTPVYGIIEKDYSAAFSALGPLAIPGYGGSGLCDTCVSNAPELSQRLLVRECRSGDYFKHDECVEYIEIWLLEPSPPVTVIESLFCETTFYAPTNGPYTVACQTMLPTETVTVFEEIYTLFPSPIDFWVTTEYTGWPGIIEIETTVTTTVTRDLPPRTEGGGWGEWGSWTSSSSYVSATYTTTSTPSRTYTTTSTPSQTYTTTSKSRTYSTSTSSTSRHHPSTSTSSTTRHHPSSSTTSTTRHHHSTSTTSTTKTHKTSTSTRSSSHSQSPWNRMKKRANDRSMKPRHKRLN